MTCVLISCYNRFFRLPSFILYQFFVCIF